MDEHHGTVKPLSHILFKRGKPPDQDVRAPVIGHIRRGVVCVGAGAGSEVDKGHSQFSGPAANGTVIPLIRGQKILRFLIFQARLVQRVHIVQEIAVELLLCNKKRIPVIPWHIKQVTV